MSKSKISEGKRKEVELLKKMIKENAIFGVADLTNLPSLQLQRMRKQLRGKMDVKMGKGRLIKIAIDQSKDKLKETDTLKSKIRGQPALIVSKENPFKLYKQLQKEKSSAPAKAGQIAPNDIYVRKGKTPFAPGPIIGELGQLGIKTGVEEGKVAITEDKLLVKAGEIIKPKIADVLVKLKIEPMEVGINLIFAYENGVIYERDVLGIDEAKVIKDMQNIYRWGINLAVYAGIYEKDVMKFMIKKAELEAKALGTKVNIEESETTKDKEEPKEEKPEEEKPEEDKVKEVEDLAKKVMWGEAGGEIER
ncbi:MAG: 50S ribosomal protein L10 [Candidatus Nanoarchaeia archaeon]|nr:50S ribosomal protein L10 [Candidatus Nanoarchaeia archaeon]